jgi:hypothetical protein
MFCYPDLKLCIIFVSQEESKTLLHNLIDCPTFILCFSNFPYSYQKSNRRGGRCFPGQTSPVTRVGIIHGCMPGLKWRNPLNRQPPVSTAPISLIKNTVFAGLDKKGARASSNQPHLQCGHPDAFQLQHNPSKLITAKAKN